MSNATKILVVPVFLTMSVCAASCDSPTRAGGAEAGSDAGPPFVRLSPAGLADSQAQWGYSQVIVTDPGVRMVYVAGSTGDDEIGTIVAPGDFAAQVERAFQNIRTALAAAGASGEDVIRLRMYIVNYDHKEHWPIVGAAMARYFGQQGPVATMVGVAALAEPEILFEADVTAAIR